jgi:amino acid transporter
MELYYRRAGEMASLLTSVRKAQVRQFATGAAQGVDASRVVFAFARDNALPGSRWWKQINPHTQTPVNAVWLVMFCAGICGLLGFSSAALISLAG